MYIRRPLCRKSNGNWNLRDAGFKPLRCKHTHTQYRGKQKVGNCTLRAVGLFFVRYHTVCMYMDRKEQKCVPFFFFLFLLLTLKAVSFLLSIDNIKYTQNSKRNSLSKRLWEPFSCHILISNSVFFLSSNLVNEIGGGGGDYSIRNYAK